MSRVPETRKLQSVNHKSVFMRSARVTAIFGVMVVAGCAAHQKDHNTTASIPSDYRTNHPIVVSESEQSVDLIVAPTMRKMSHEHRNKVVDIVGRFKRSGAKDIHVILPAGSHNEVAARHVSAGIVKEMKKMDVSARNIKIERYHASNHGDAATIRIVYGALGAHVASQCGQWNENLADTDKNVNYENFGCATQNNLAQMIANPADLLGPRGETEIDAARRDNVINNWRENGSED